MTTCWCFFFIFYFLQFKMSRNNKQEESTSWKHISIVYHTSLVQDNMCSRHINDFQVPHITMTPLTNEYPYQCNRTKIVPATFKRYDAFSPDSSYCSYSGSSRTTIHSSVHIDSGLKSSFFVYVAALPFILAIMTRHGFQLGSGLPIFNLLIKFTFRST